MGGSSRAGGGRVHSRGRGCRRGVWEIAATLQSTKNRHSRAPPTPLFHISTLPFSVPPASSPPLCSLALFHLPPLPPVPSEVTIPHLPLLTPPPDSFATPSATVHKRTNERTKRARTRERAVSPVRLNAPTRTNTHAPHGSRYTSTHLRPAYITSRLVTHRV